MKKEQKEIKNKIKLTKDALRILTQKLAQTNVEIYKEKKN
tara:strand:+ start:5146 stop:5265 length:120 start_codon:yes stop_codon:yes gene_type:complete